MELVKQKNKGYKKVRGIGINDAPEDYIVVRYEHINGKRVKVWECPFYSDWTNMLTRCTSEDGKYSYEYNDNHNGTYVGVSCIPDWLSFWTFRSWAITQNWEGNHLDKDLLGDGTYYSPDTCCYIPAVINSSINRGRSSDLPFGVSHGHKKGYPYTSSVRSERVTLFKTMNFTKIEDAHNYWKKGKIVALQQLADKYINKGLIDIRVYNGLQNKISKLKISLENNTLIYKL